MSTINERLVKLETIVDGHTKILDKLDSQCDRIEDKLSTFPCAANAVRFHNIEGAVNRNRKWIKAIVLALLASGIGVGSLKAIPESKSEPPKVELRK